jgi:lipopolysaccharide/colanic/teichoic acid biosynthesis glycosyltransferase
MPPTLMHRVQLKRAFDLTFAFIGLLAVLPLMIVIATAVWAGDRGPVLIAQERVGWRRRTFRMFKFRTMVVHAERATGPTWSWVGDPRVTWVGRILRSTHLDELPQLWNVLLGEMSFVGPRPERAMFVERLEQVIPGYTNRLAIRPGITGLSQLRNGYDESLRTVRRKIRYDLLYVRRGCTLLDAMILVDTGLLMVGLSGGLALRKVAVHATPRWPSAAVRSRGSRRR